MNTKRSTTSGQRAAAVFVSLLALTLHTLTCTAATLVTSSLDGGGGRSSAGNYVNDSSVGGIGGISTNAVSPPETAKAGYIGQLYDVASMTVTGTPSPVNENSTSQLRGTATLDDATVVALAGSNMTWGAYGWPIHDISVSGVVTTENVYADTPATVNCTYLGVPGSGLLLVLDTNPDDYGSYASDNLPDGWQVQYFGLPPNSNAAPSADADGTGQNNLFKYVAGLDPTNRASVFVLQIQNVNGQPSQKNLIFNPEVSGRTYTPQFRTNLVSGVWATLTGIGGPTTNVNQVTVTDLNAIKAQKFYRIDISLP